MSRKEKYADTPEGWQARWTDEFSAAKKKFNPWHKEGDKVIKRFLDERKGGPDDFYDSQTRLNLFHSNIVTLKSMLYGRIPKVEVARRFADADDDQARVAAEILTRMLNTDIEEAGEDISSVFRSCLEDRLLPGLGEARVRYEFNEGKKQVPAMMGSDGEELAPAYEEDEITDEWVDTVYTHWKDILWSPARTYGELRWKAYRSYLNREEFQEKFPDCELDDINFSSKPPGANQKTENNDNSANPQAEVWEIWDKTRRMVFWYHEGYHKILKKEKDFLELDGFWPSPPPMIANATTTRYMPRSDFALAQDLYNEIDELETRITMLTRACKLVGVYDKQNDGVKRMFTEGVENDLIPVDNWAMFSEKQGLKGVIDWLPLEQVVNAVDVLSQKQNEKIQKLYQVTGMNDIMRGAAMSSDRTSATRDKLEANYGSIRIEALQNDFARWVSDLQSLKAEIIAKHFQTYCILEQSNIMATPDAMHAEQAIQLIKNPKNSRWRITVRPETLAIADYAQLKQDRMEYIMGLSQFLQSAAPMLEQYPESMPILMKLLKWGLSGFRGSNEIEGVVDQAINQAEDAPPKEKPDPAAQKAEMEMQKMQMEMQMEQQKQAAETEREREKHQASMALEQQKLQLEQEKAQMELFYMKQKFEMELEMKRAELGLKVQETKIKAAADAQEQASQFAFNTAEREHEAKLQMESGDEDLRRDQERAKLKPDRPNGDA